MCNDCCYCFCSKHFYDQFCCTLVTICGGTVVYVTAGICIFESIKCCCNQLEENHICKKCKACCRKDKNVIIQPVEAPSPHVIIRNPDESIQLGIC